MKIAFGNFNKEFTYFKEKTSHMLFNMAIFAFVKEIKKTLII